MPESVTEVAAQVHLWLKASIKIMLNCKKSILTFIFLCCALINARAQHTFNSGTSRLNMLQDSLLRLERLVQDAPSNTERFADNAQFVKTLVKALKIPGSYNFGFDSVKYLSIVKSPDKAFRIFSWAVGADDGTYRFFGAIQMATKDGQLKLYPLIDATEEIKDNNEITSNKKWFGSRYYEIVPVVNSGKQTFYILLGWKGNTIKTTKKVIEILSFEKDEVIFGKNVLESTKNGPFKNRIVFEYNKLNSMTLRLDKTVGMVVFDHLVPLSPDMTGNFEYYGSDSSFDAYRPVGGHLKLVENVELKNNPNEKDELYTDPKNKKITPIKKL